MYDYIFCVAYFICVVLAVGHSTESANAKLPGTATVVNNGESARFTSVASAADVPTANQAVSVSCIKDFKG